MNRLIAACVSVLVAVMAFAQSDAVKMISYRANMQGVKSVIELTNCSQDTIYNISYRLRFLNRDGHVEQTEVIDRETMRFYPGDTMALRVATHVCADSLVADSTRSCIIEFDLMGYNALDENGEPYGRRPAGFGIEPLLWFILIVVVIAVVIYVALLVSVAVAARNRRRSVVGWLILSLLITPFIALLILLSKPAK